MDVWLAPCQRCGGVVHRPVGDERFKCARCGIVTSVTLTMPSIPAAEPVRPVRAEPAPALVDEPEAEVHVVPRPRRVGRRRQRRRRPVTYVLSADEPAPSVPVEPEPDVEPEPIAAEPETFPSDHLRARRAGRRRRRRRRPVTYVPPASSTGEPALTPIVVPTARRRWTWPLSLIHI